MKKTIWSLAALMLMAAPVMTSCSNYLDEVAPAEEVKSNIVTITIAPPVAEPETRVAMTGNVVTGWAENDEVILYKVTTRDENIDIDGTGVTFRCIDAANGKFSGDLGSNNIGDYTFAVYGAVADCPQGDFIALVPKTMCSANLKDVVIMAAYKSGSTYTMQVVNNVLKVTNSGAAAEVAWSVTHYNTTLNPLPVYTLAPLSYYAWNEDSEAFGFLGKTGVATLAKYKGWTNATHFTLPNGVSYVTMGICANAKEKWGLAKEDGTEVVTRKAMTGKVGVKGKIYSVSI